MNQRFSGLLTGACALVLASAVANARAESASTGVPACEPRLISAATDFPGAGRQWRDQGLVRVQVLVDEAGAVLEAKVHESSGRPKLDAAAVRSAQANWRFDVTGCEAVRFPFAKEVEVQFEPAPVQTFSAMQTGAYRQRLRSATARGCDVSGLDGSAAITSCVTRSATAGSRLAAR